MATYEPRDKYYRKAREQGLPSRAAADIPAGVSNPPRFTSDISQQDQTGPCGFVLERDKDLEMSQEVRH